jgi:hypothetical protein
MGRKRRIEKNGSRLFRRPKLTLSCSAKGKEGRKEGRKVLNKVHVNPLKHSNMLVFNLQWGLVTAAWHVLRLWLEETTSRYGG